MPWTSTTTRSTGFLVTAAVWNPEIVDNMTFLEQVNHTEFTADVSITATTVGTANQIVSAGAIDYEAVPHEIEFYCPMYSPPATTTNFILRDGSTVLGNLARNPASQVWPGVNMKRVLTPTAASHTYNIAAWNGAAGTGTVEAGTGGTAGDATTFLAGYIRITRIPT